MLVSCQVSDYYRRPLRGSWELGSSPSRELSVIVHVHIAPLRTFSSLDFKVTKPLWFTVL